MAYKAARQERAERCAARARNGFLPLLASGALLLWTPPASATAVCDPQSRSAALPVEIEVPAGQWLKARLIEDGNDWVLLATQQGWRLETDTAPSRLAIEHLTLPGSIFRRLTVDARAWSGDSLHKPALQYTCVPWDSSLMASIDLMWGGAWLVERERAGGAAAAVRLDQQARAHFGRVISESDDPGLQAAAQHSSAYLLTRVGRREEAADAFDQAARLWQLAGQRGAHLAARFHAAQARLNGGTVSAASAALEELRNAQDLHQWPFLQRWIDNDRCAARLELGQWDQAASCFDQQAEQFQAQGLDRESALARCNRLAALAGGHRWREAQTATADCVTHQFASGSPRGRAQALHLRGWVRLQSGELLSGISDLASALELLEAAGDDPMAWQVRSLLAGAWLVLDEEPRAIALLQTGLTEFPRERDPGTHARLLHQLGSTQRWSRAEQAVATLESARDQYAQLGWKRLEDAIECDLAIAGAGPAPMNCALGKARAALRSGESNAVQLQALSAALAEDDWATRLLWLELAVDAAQRGADPGAVAAAIRQLIDRSQALQPGTELTRRVRAAVQLELAGAAAALAADSGEESLARVALDLARKAGPPLSSARSVLFGVTEFEPLLDRQPLTHPAEPMPLAPLPTDTAELGYLRFGGHAYWLIARSDQVRALRAPPEQDSRDLALRWLRAIDQQAEPAQLRAITAAIAEHLSLDKLLRVDDRVLLTRFNGPVADLPWSALPRDGFQAMSRLGYAPLGATLAVIAVAGDIDASKLSHPVAIDQLAAVDPVDLPLELAGSRSESVYLRRLAEQYRLPLKLRPLAKISERDIGVSTSELFLLSGHAAADRVTGDVATLRLGVDGSRRWGTVDLESWREPPAVLILGACESAAGPERRYFGDFGLASAAARSGAPWVLGHRWPVDDQAAAELHRAFVDALLGGASPAQSLVRAQLSMTESRRFAHPRHWAGALLIHSP